MKTLSNKLFPSLRLSLSLCFLLLAGVSFLVGCGGGSSGVTTTPTPPSRDNSGSVTRVLLQLQPGTDINAIAQRQGGRVVEQVPGTNTFVLESLRSDDTDFHQRLQGDNGVSTLEDDSPVLAPEPAQGDPFHFPIDFAATASPAFDTALRSQIDAPAGSFGRSKQNSPIVIAVLDTGVARSHPALVGHLLSGTSTLYTTGPAQSEEEVADGTNNKGVGHGTMIAGIIARLAPSVKILPIRVLNSDGTGTTLSLIRGIRYALDHGAKVISMSCEFKQKSDALQDAIHDVQDHGAILVASAGNDNTQYAPYPAGDSHVIAVASVESDNTKSFYSNYGSWVSVSAPGTGIESTWWQGGYAKWSGTSFATPCVSAEAALLFADTPSTRPDDIRKIIQNSSLSLDSLNSSYSGKLGKGVIQIQAALRLLHSGNF